MKIGIVLCKYNKTGISTYFYTLLNAFKKYISEDTDMFIYRNSELSNADYNDIEEAGYKTCCRTEEDKNLLNSYDILLLGSHICYKQAGADEARDYCDFFSKDITKPKKIICFNEHKFSCDVWNYGYDYIVNKDYICSFDGIMLFGNNTATAKKWKKLIGEDEFNKRFIQMLLPYDIDENNRKSSWVPAKDKKKSILYLGRSIDFKHPELMVPIRKKLDNSWIVECRGMARGFAVFVMPDIAFEFDENGKPTKNPSKYTRWITGKFLKNECKLEYNKNKNMPIGLGNQFNESDKIWIYGPYNLSTVYDEVKYSAFNCDFFELANVDDYGKQTIEYCQVEFISNGVIPVLNYDFGKNTYLIENGEITNKCFLDIDTGLYLKRDLSNIDEFVDKLNYLINNPDKYEEFRENCYNNWKTHTNPEAIIKKLYNDIMSK